MSILQVPGAQLYYETRGGGPLLVMVAGATGDARIFAGVGKFLAEHYTVLPTIAAASPAVPSTVHRTTTTASRSTPTTSTG